MKSEQHAELAREQHAEFLRKHGAHAISVEQVPIGGRTRFAVVATFDKKPPARLPGSLKVSTSDGTVEVPLVVRQEERFQLE